jgi:exosortase
MPADFSPSTTNPFPSPAAAVGALAAARTHSREAVAVLLPLALWALAIWHFASEWSLNAQYRYGWAVPFLALYLLSLRFPTRPAGGKALPARLAGWALAALSLLAAAALPFREANPEWRLLGWLFAGTALGATFLLLARAGGWPWVRHFAFPLLFFLTAVPWPRPQETALMNHLMHGNAAAAAESLRWLGFEATTAGNLIQLPAGTVSVDGACSGVRSLQGFLMMTLFLGELLELSPRRRLFLVAAGIAGALAGNFARTTTLGWLAARDGLPSMEHWHDTIGYVTLGAGFGLLLGLASLLHSSSRPMSPVQRPAAAPPFSLSSLRETSFASIAGLALLGLSLLGTQGWFTWHERGATHLPPWSLRFPTAQPAYHEDPISEPVQAQLLFDEGHSAGWADDAGRRWHAFYLRWAPGRTWEQSVLVHDPRICLQAAGLTLAETLPPVPLDLPGLHLEFDAYRFRDPSGDVFVFNCVASDLIRPTGPVAGVPLSRSARWGALAAGLRHRGQRRLEVGLWGAASAEDAVGALREFLERSVAVGSGE